VQELGRAVGYELNPGVAAGTYLAFTLEEGLGAPAKISIPIGTKVQSVPGPDEQAEIFETVEDIDARPEWNVLKPAQRQPNPPRRGAKSIYLQGITTGLQPGDSILFVGSGRKADPESDDWEFKSIENVDPQPESGCTKITWTGSLEKITPNPELDGIPEVYALRLRAALFGHNAPDWRSMPDTIKNAYLGQPSETTIDNTVTEWPGYTMNSICSGYGLSGRYYDYNPNRANGDLIFGAVKYTRIDKTIDFNWGSGSPAAGVNQDFMVCWEGWIHPACSGSYMFSTSADDGVRLYLGKNPGDEATTLIIDDLSSHTEQEHDSQEVWLEADKYYKIVLHYFDSGGAAVVHLSWTRTDTTAEQEQVIPFYVLLPSLSLTPGCVQLDAFYPQICPGDNSWLVLTTPENIELYKISSATQDAQSNFTLSSQTTRLVLGKILESFDNKLRETVVYAQSERLEIASGPLTMGPAVAFGTEFPLDMGTLAPAEGASITLDRQVTDLPPERLLIVAGKRVRARVAPDLSTALTLTNDVTGEAIQPGETLIALGPPTVTNGSVTWRLRKDDGFEGTVSNASISDFRLTTANAEDEEIREQVAVQSSEGYPTVVRLAGAGLGNIFDRATVAIYANVAWATHGDTREEVLGSADASQSYQQFELCQGPVTYTGASTATGGQSTLQIRVNDILWNEVPTLYGLGPIDHAYTARPGSDGNVVVQFGDGVNGARPPSGDENVGANYRIGLGTAGNVQADQLRVLLTRPLGVSGVSNPRPASGGADPEDPADGRQNAPCTTLTLQRIVTLRDYEDFVRAFGRVAKVRADWLWDGTTGVVYINVVGIDGSKMDLESLNRLRQAIDASRDPAQHVRVETAAATKFKIAVRVIVASGYRDNDVTTAARAALRSTFGLKNRDFGQDLAESDILGLLQSVEGVQAAALKEPYPGGAKWDSEKGRLIAAVARWNGADIEAADLLVLDETPDAISFSVVGDLAEAE